MEMHAYGMPNGIMCWWKPVESAAVYHVNLYVDCVKDGNPDQLRIKTEDEDRNTLAHSFVNLAKLDDMMVHNTQSWLKLKRMYYVEVEAEDRSGKVIDVSSKVKCGVE